MSRSGALPPIGKSADLSGMNLCRAEREFFTIVKRGSWNELGPHCRLALLRDCAVHHIEWSHFTPNCQLWVLGELARVSTEGVYDAVGEGAKAIAPLRLKTLVKANPPLASQLSDICENNLALPKVADKLRFEIHTHEQSLLRASSGSPRSSGRPATGSTMASTAGFRKSRNGNNSLGFKGSPTATQQTATSEPASRRRGRNRTEQVPSTKHSASAPDLHKATTKRLAPLNGAHRFGSNPSRCGSGQHTPELDRAASKQEEVMAAGPKTSASELASTVWDETRQAFFRNKAEEVKVGIPSDDESEEPKVMRTTFNLLPSHSSEGQAARSRELRRQEAVNAMDKAIVHLKSCGEQLLDCATAVIRVSGIKKERMKLRQEVEKAFLDYSEVNVVENKEHHTDDHFTWDVHILDDMSLVGAALRIKNEIKGFQYDMDIVWPLELAIAEVNIAFPEYELSIEDLTLITPAIVESYRLYADTWMELLTDKKVITAAGILMDRDSYSVREGKLAFTNPGLNDNSIADAPKQGAHSFDQLMADAAWAHMLLKEIIAPDSPWASALMNDLEVLSENDPSRTLRPEVEGPFKGAWLYDPGVKTPAYVDQKAQLRHEPYETNVPWHDAGVVSRLEIVFDNFNQMSSTVDHFLGELQDLGFLQVRWIDNGCRRPSCLGLREISIGVCISEEGVDGCTRSHTCEVKISHQYLNYQKHGVAKEKLLVIQSVLEACGVQPQDMDVICEVLWAALDTTRPAVLQKKIQDFDRVARAVHALKIELSDVLKPADIEGCDALIGEMALQAEFLGVPRVMIDRLLRRFTHSAEVEAKEWAKSEAERLAILEAETKAKEAAERALKEEADRAKRAEEERIANEEGKAERERNEAKAKRSADAEAKKAAKEAEVSAKAADRDAEKQMEAELKARAKSVTEEFLASKGLDSVHAIHESGRPALLIAAAEGDAFLVESVLMQGADIRAASSEDGAGAMHHAAAVGDASRAENLAVLLRYGMSIEAQTENGERPMHFAAGSGHIEALDCLKNAGAKINAKSMAGRTPLFTAAMKDKVECAEWLLENAGAAVDVKDDDGIMLLHVAALHNAPKMVAWLLSKGADAGAKDGSGQTAKAIAKKNKCKKALEAFGE